jgi:chromosome segregation ATPase
MMIAWALTVAILLAAVRYLWKIIGRLNEDVDQAGSAMSQMRDRIYDMTVRANKAEEHVRHLEQELSTGRDELQEAKSKFGILRKNLSLTLDDIRGKGFRNKSGSIERSKQFRHLRDTLEKLGNGK